MKLHSSSAQSECRTNIFGIFSYTHTHTYNLQWAINCGAFPDNKIRNEYKGWGKWYRMFMICFGLTLVSFHSQLRIGFSRTKISITWVKTVYSVKLYLYVMWVCGFSAIDLWSHRWTESLGYSVSVVVCVCVYMCATKTTERFDAHPLI